MEIVKELTSATGDRVQLCVNARGQYQVRVKSTGNNETLLPTEDHPESRKAVHNVKRIKEALNGVDLDELLA